MLGRPLFTFIAPHLQDAVKQINFNGENKRKEDMVTTMSVKEWHPEEACGWGCHSNPTAGSRCGRSCVHEQRGAVGTTAPRCGTQKWYLRVQDIADDEVHNMCS